MTESRLQTATRVPEDADDHKLIAAGWKFSGLSLFTHNSVIGNKSKSDAITLTDNNDIVCGLCGVSDVCECLHRSEYDEAYNKMEAEYNQMLTLARGICDWMQNIKMPPAIMNKINKDN